VFFALYKWKSLFNSDFKVTKEMLALQIAVLLISGSETQRERRNGRARKTQVEGVQDEGPFAVRGRGGVQQGDDVQPFLLSERFTVLHGLLEDRHPGTPGDPTR
jgi:hypothetical protein